MATTWGRRHYLEIDIKYKYFLRQQTIEEDS
jgi:hypothetical protein